MVRFANKCEEERRAMSPTTSEKEVNDRDFLSRFLAALKKDTSIPGWYAASLPLSRFLLTSRHHRQPITRNALSTGKSDHTD
jgi:hypothetical protein